MDMDVLSKRGLAHCEAGVVFLSSCVSGRYMHLYVYDGGFEASRAERTMVC